MTCKDYNLIADTFATLATDPHLDDYKASAILSRFGALLSDALAQDNPRFDRQRFIEACYRGSKPPTLGPNLARRYA